MDKNVKVKTQQFQNFRHDKIRWRIDELDQTILEAINRRAKLALQIAKEKQKANLPLRTPSREAKVLSQVRQGNQGPLDDQAVERIFSTVVAECLRLEKEVYDDSGNET